MAKIIGTVPVTEELWVVLAEKLSDGAWIQAPYRVVLWATTEDRCIDEDGDCPDDHTSVIAMFFKPDETVLCSIRDFPSRWLGYANSRSEAQTKGWRDEAVRVGKEIDNGDEKTVKG